MKSILNSCLLWENELPVSASHNDIYFSTQDGLAETEYVFLNSNNLPKRFAALKNSLVIAETGFGTGLNFLATWSAWQKSQNSQAQLTFISVEKYPLKVDDLSKALSLWPELAQLSQALIAQYPLSAAGFHQLTFEQGRIRLLLLLGDAVESYTQLDTAVDAWYLDGFAPSKNPDMWSPELFREIARLSHPGTTFSTFTAAGIVKRGLKEVGFEVRKQKGFGRKREMLVGTFTEHKQPLTSKHPWFDLPTEQKPAAVTVIGGGLAGCSSARALAERGIQVTLIEKEAQLATAGSGNRQGALYAKLPVTPTTQGDLHLTGFLHTVNKLKQMDPNQTLWSQCGVAQLATTEKEHARQKGMLEKQGYPDTLMQYKTADELTTLAGTDIAFSGLFYPDAGWVSPQAFCKRLVEHDNISVIQADIQQLDYADNKWSLQSTDKQTFKTSHAVICNAELANQFTQTKHLKLKPIRGQVSIAKESNASDQLRTVICGDGYISPAKEQHYCFGATFDLKGRERNVTAEDHQFNLDKLTKAAPVLGSDLSKHKLDGRTAFRCSTPDYMPIVGPAPVYDAFIEHFAPLRKDKNWQFEDVSPKHYPGLYVNTGHGSKGLVTCPISAELIAAMLCTEPLPLPKNMIDTLNPSRFIIKNLIRKAI